MNKGNIGVIAAGALAAAAVFAAAYSAVPMLWFALLGSAFFAAIFVPPSKGPVLAWIIAINMVAIIADLFNYELSEQGNALFLVVNNQNLAILYSCVALCALAAGMRFGLVLMKKKAPPKESLQVAAFRYDPAKIFLLYILFFPVSYVISLVGDAVPGLSQVAYVFGLVRFAIIYWLSATVFAGSGNYVWIVIVVLIEIISGSTGGFASYKEGFYVVLIALVASGARLSIRQIAIGGGGAILIIYMSLVWTVVKKEYRAEIVANGPLASVSWLAGKYIAGDVDMSEAFSLLVERIGYTKFYAMILDRDTEDYRGIYLRALEHVLMPRLLFPDKAVLDDSAETNAILRLNIASGTSIGLGYVAQAHIDFGFPGLAIPMFGLGIVLGLIYAHFMSRAAPVIIREAFAVACMFNSLAFAGDINKEFGGLVMGFLVLSLILKFFPPPLLQFASVQAKPASRTGGRQVALG